MKKGIIQDYISLSFFWRVDLRIAVSLRSDFINERQESRDCIDVRIPELLSNLGIFPILVSSSLSDVENFFLELEPQGVLLSGGGSIGLDDQRELTERALLNFARSRGLPVIGICRGAQMMNHFFGGGLVSKDGHTASYHQVTGELYPTGRVVNSFHDYSISIKTLADDLRILASSDDGSVEAFCHNTLPWLGLMWHPERNTVFDPIDLDLIRSHFFRKGR